MENSSRYWKRRRSRSRRRWRRKGRRIRRRKRWRRRRIVTPQHSRTVRGNLHALPQLPWGNWEKRGSQSTAHSPPLTAPNTRIHPHEATWERCLAGGQNDHEQNYLLLKTSNQKFLFPDQWSVDEHPTTMTGSLSNPVTYRQGKALLVAAVVRLRGSGGWHGLWIITQRSLIRQKRQDGWREKWEQLRVCSVLCILN